MDVLEVTIFISNLTFWTYTIKFILFYPSYVSFRHCQMMVSRIGVQIYIILMFEILKHSGLNKSWSWPGYSLIWPGLSGNQTKVVYWLSVFFWWCETICYGFNTAEIITLHDREHSSYHTSLYFDPLHFYYFNKENYSHEFCLLLPYIIISLLPVTSSEVELNFCLQFFRFKWFILPCTFLKLILTLVILVDLFAHLC